MIIYTESLEGITAEQLRGGFFVGWPAPPSPAAHLRILRGSAHVVLALDEETRDVVGFVTAISDGVLSAYIPLLEVLPGYQGQGLGTELMRRMMERLGHLYMVDVVCDQELQPFYARFGMHPWTAMMARNRAASAC